ncbi:SDR family NAD(P)-dependent oxidoreductase [Anditalea andensis]|uniref:Short-chain dehydrogenase n=1 Tax=Anditalea andensis TaxID=1048983 RepID=A0A074L078_9BACT|nr:SDR family NAD(P)-dependent oxidoreductase [Anditalea andensis]KEO75611.1 short-chain dehydrogenase [Anditalea andensis]
MDTFTQKTWFITGTSKGLGLDLTKLLLSQGHKVIATSRDTSILAEELAEFKETLLPIKLDITSDRAVKNAIEYAIEKFGQIDVLVNNAGYCLVGSMEEMTDEEFRDTLNVNLFGTVNTIRNVMPYMRKQESGHVINISSVSGYTGNAKAASYNAAKFGVIGLTEGFAKEVEAFGIKATVVAPGQFRTAFMDSLQYVKNRIGVYGIDEAEKLWSSMSGKQNGDPQKLAKVIVKIAEMEQPPLHLVVGTDVYEPVRVKRKAELDEMKTWASLSLSTDFD